MEQIEEVLDELLNAIRNSDEYTRYQKIRKKVHEFPTLEHTLNEYRKQNYELQNSGRQNLYWEVDKLDEEFPSLKDNAYAQEYLAAELALCRIFQQINWKLVDSLEFDVDFLNDSN